MNPDLQLLATRLRKASHRNGSLVACCPFHEDSTPSFIVYANGGWNCAGCHRKGAAPELYSHLGLECPENGERRDANTKVVYEYHDAKGRLIGRVERIDLAEGGKTFRQHTIGEDGKWSPRKHYPLPFFRLPALQSAQPGALVWVVEGEKNVEALCAIGQLATTSSGGAGNLRHSDLSGFEALKGKRVIIVPDNDDQGEAHAQDWLTECRKRRIDACIVRLPNAPRKKYDIYDWLAEGNRLEPLLEIADTQTSLTRDAQRLATELRELVAKLENGANVKEVGRDAIHRIASRGGATEKSSVTLSEAMHELGKEILDGKTAMRVFTGIASVDCIVGGFRPGRMVTLGGCPGAGKTALVGQLAEYWATTYGPVLAYSQEMSAVELAERAAVRHYKKALNSVSAGEAFALEDFFRGLDLTICERSVTLDWLEADLHLWRALRGDATHAFCIIDYLQIMGRESKDFGGESGEYRFITEATRRIKTLARDSNTTILLLSQLSRDSQSYNEPSMRAFKGGGSIEADSDVCLCLWHDNTLHVLKNRGGGCGKATVYFDKPFMTFESALPAEVEVGWQDL